MRLHVPTNHDQNHLRYHGTKTVPLCSPCCVELIAQETQKSTARKALVRRRWWVRPWIQRHDQLGYFNNLMVELAKEDTDSFKDFSRTFPHVPAKVRWGGPHARSKTQPWSILKNEIPSDISVTWQWRVLIGYRRGIASQHFPHFTTRWSGRVVRVFTLHDRRRLSRMRLNSSSLIKPGRATAPDCLQQVVGLPTLHDPIVGRSF